MGRKRDGAGSEHKNWQVWQSLDSELAQQSTGARGMSQPTRRIGGYGGWKGVGSQNSVKTNRTYPH